MIETATIRYMHEDDLPDNITAEEYNKLYPSSKVIDGFRMFPYINVIVGSNSCVRVFLEDKVERRD